MYEKVTNRITGKLIKTKYKLKPYESYEHNDTPV